MAEELDNKEEKIEGVAAENAEETSAPVVPKEEAVEPLPEEAAAEEAAAEDVPDLTAAKKPSRKKAKKEEELTSEAEGQKWYVVQTYSGQEDRVKESIERNVKNMNMGHKIAKVLVPVEDTVELKDGKRIEKIRKMFPGYVFIEMFLDDESWYVIRETPGVAKFIGTKVRPTPVLDKEMQRVLKQIGVKAEKLEIAFERGESVRIISGPFRGYTGSIDEINAQKGKLKTLISIFGRDTPVEVNFEQVQKIV